MQFLQTEQHNENFSLILKSSSGEALLAFDNWKALFGVWSVAHSKEAEHCFLKSSLLSVRFSWSANYLSLLTSIVLGVFTDFICKKISKAWSWVDIDGTKSEYAII